MISIKTLIISVAVSIFFTAALFGIITESLFGIITESKNNTSCITKTVNAYDRGVKDALEIEENKVDIMFFEGGIEKFLAKRKILFLDELLEEYKK